MVAAQPPDTASPLGGGEINQPIVRLSDNLTNGQRCLAAEKQAIKGLRERRMGQAGEKFDRITVVPAYQQVADAIEREILARRIRPGEPIGTEAQLVKQFGVNRSTVREGIRLLEQAGLIHRDSSRRLMASLPHYKRLATRMSRAMLLHEVTFRELWEATTALEIKTVEEAAEQASAEELRELDANVAATERASRDPSVVAELDTQFHSLRNLISHFFNEVLHPEGFHHAHSVTDKASLGSP